MHCNPLSLITTRTFRLPQLLLCSCLLQSIFQSIVALHALPSKPPILYTHNFLSFNTMTSTENKPLDMAAAVETNQTSFLRNLVDKFQANDFLPTLWFGTNEHWQTIAGSGALSRLLFGSKARPFQTTEEIIDTPDGDFFDCEFTTNLEKSQALVIVLHGLESTSKGDLVTNFVSALMDKGFGCIMPNFRGCSGKTHNNPGGYHMGFTADVDHLVDVLNQRYPEKQIYLCGFSLGGNVLLKFLGEQGDNAWKRNIRGAAVTCVPFDPAACHRKIDVGFNRAVYSENFLATIKAKAELQIKQFPGIFDIEEVRKARTIGEIDDSYIAKLYGFNDKWDYYAKCGSKWFLSKIRVPVVAINAIDDPFIEASSLPTEADVQGAPVRLIYHPYGGHCGFWARRMSSDPQSPAVPPHGWIGEELSRALAYFHAAGSPPSK